jgi:hypothetical protein
MRPATPSERLGVLVFDIWVARNRHGRGLSRSSPAISMLGRIMLGIKQRSDDFEAAN